MITEVFDKYAHNMSHLSGLLAVNFVGIAKGNLLHTVSFSGLNYNDTAKFEAEIVKNALQAVDNQLIPAGALRQITINNNEQMHILYVFNDLGYLIHLVADAKINFALLGLAHKENFAILEQGISSEMIQKEVVPSQAPKKVTHFKSMFFS